MQKYNVTKFPLDAELRKKIEHGTRLLISHRITKIIPRSMLVEAPSLYIFENDLAEMELKIVMDLITIGRTRKIEVFTYHDSLWEMFKDRVLRKIFPSSWVKVRVVEVSVNPYAIFPELIDNQEALYLVDNVTRWINK